MNETLKKLTEDVKLEIKSWLQSAEVQEAVKQIKESTEDNGTFEFVASTSDVDRSGEVIDQGGWDLSFYKMNPILLWAHDYKMLPLGVCESVEVVKGKLIIKGRFASAAANPFAQQVRKLYDEKILNAVSVGFIVKDAEGNTITSQELLEVSVVPVPANPMALTMRKATELALDVEMLRVKGFEITEEKDAETLSCPNCKAECQATDKFCAKCGTELKKAEEEAVKANDPQAGDACTMEDGTDGMMAMVDGEMTCVLKEAKKEVEEKGAVADELINDDNAEKKYCNVDEVWEIMEAFFDVYFDEQTPVENFGTLLAETAGLLSALATGPMPCDQPTEKSVKIKTVVARAQKYISLKAGRTVSGSNLEKLDEICQQIIKSGSALDSFIKEVSTGDVVEDSQQALEKKAVADNTKRSKTGGLSEMEKSLDDYISLRQVLRAVDNSIGSSLEAINAKIREQSQSKK